MLDESQQKSPYSPTSSESQVEVPSCSGVQVASSESSERIDLRSPSASQSSYECEDGGNRPMSGRKGLFVD